MSELTLAEQSAALRGGPIQTLPRGKELREAYRLQDARRHAEAAARTERDEAEAKRRADHKADDKRPRPARPAPVASDPAAELVALRSERAARHAEREAKRPAISRSVSAEDLERAAAESNARRDELLAADAKFIADQQAAKELHKAEREAAELTREQRAKAADAAWAQRRAEQARAVKQRQARKAAEIAEARSASARELEPAEPDPG